MSSEKVPVDLATLEPGMDLCTVDFKKWGELIAVRTTATGSYLCVVLDEAGSEVFVPAEAIVETHGRCIRLDRPRASIDDAGWEARPSALTQ